MAQATNYMPSANVSVWYQDEAIVGTEPDDAGLTKLQTTSFTIPEASMPLEYSTQRSGQFTSTVSMGHHAQGTKLWTFDTVLKGTPKSVNLACQAVFEDGDGTNELASTYIFPTTGYTVATGSGAKTFDIRFVNGGTKAAAETIECAGCVGTGFTLSEDIGSEGGELTVTINWATGFMPVHSATDITSPAYDTGTPKNIRSLVAASSEIESGNDMVIQSWELSCSRTIERVHYSDTTNGAYHPFGYAMTGQFEVTGSMTVIRNDDVHDLLAKFYDGSTVDINLAESSGFTVTLNRCFIGESSVDSGGAVLMQTIPFTAVGANDISSASTVLGIAAS